MFRIRFRAQLGFLGVVLTSILAPAPAAAGDHEFNTSRNAGSFGVSLSDAQFRAAGLGQGTFVGRYMYEMDFALTPSSEPLAREFAGTIDFTSPFGGPGLTMAVTGTIRLSPNDNLIVIERGVAEVVGGTRRFEGAAGGGVFSLVGELDDSGTAGFLQFNMEAIVTLPERSR